MADKPDDFFFHVTPRPDACKHDFRGGHDLTDDEGRVCGFTTVCTKCGMDAMTYSLRCGELIDIAADVRGETEKAWRLHDGTKTEWVPKSQVEQNGDGTFTMPEWLAKDKGFI